MHPASKFLFIPLLFICLVMQYQTAWAQHIPLSSDITKGFRTGNSLLLTPHFDDQIKLSILDKEYDTGKEEATKILDTFFTAHVPENFEIKFESEKKESKFVIAIMSTAKGNYRVNLYFKKNGDKDVVQLLRIEKENEASF